MNTFLSANKKPATRFAITLTLVITALVSACNSKNNHSEQSSADVSASTRNSTKKEYFITVTRPNTTVHLIDMQTDKVVRQCHLDIGPGPGTVVMSPDKKIAYILTDHFANVYGVNIDDCQIVFSTQQAEGNIRVKSIAALAVSKDGKFIYTHQNRVKLHNDHYQILSPKIAVFDASGGKNTKPSKLYDAPRQVTTMDTLVSGELIIGGQDIFLMDTATGDYHMLLKSLHRSDPKYAPRDVLTVWQTGTVNNEFFRLYSTAKFTDDSQNLDTAQWLWGYERVDLTTGKAESKDMGPINAVLFTGIRRPGHLNEVYGALNHIKQFDTNTTEEVRSIDLEHTYYAINFNHDGSKIYLAGALNDIAVYDADSLEKITTIPLTGDGGMATNVVFKR